MASTTKTYTISDRTRKEWRGGTVTKFVDGDDLGPWYYCSLCSHRAVDPCCCPNGDVFCRECALEYLLSKMDRNTKKKFSIEDSHEEINKFLELQKLTLDKNLNKVYTKKDHTQIITKHNHAKCPKCRKKLKYTNLLNLIVTFEDDEPICQICSRHIVKNLYAYRLSCGHVVCIDCKSNIIEKSEKCSICYSRVNLNDTILLDKTIIGKKLSGGKIELKYKGPVDSFG